MKLSRQLLFGVIVFLLGAGVAVVGSDDESSTPHLGPEPGLDVAGYVRSRTQALEDASGLTAAVVSFQDYLDEADATAALADQLARRWLVAAPTAAPEAVQDVGEWAGARAMMAREEATALESVIPTTEDPDFVRQYELDRDRLRHLADALDSGTPVIFGAVVIAPASTLRGLATHPSVRLVDVVASPVSVRGLRPEERELTGQPPTRP